MITIIKKINNIIINKDENNIIEILTKGKFSNYNSNNKFIFSKFISFLL